MIVWTFRIQKLKIGTLADFEKKSFSSLFLMRKPLSSDQKWFLNSECPYYHLPISKKIHRETFFVSHSMLLPLVLCHSCERSGCFRKIGLKQVSVSQFCPRISKAILFLNWLLLEQINKTFLHNEKLSQYQQYNQHNQYRNYHKHT